MHDYGATREDLYEIARALRVSIAWFFEGLADPAAGPLDGVAEDEAPPFAHNFLMSQEGVDLANLFPRLPQRRWPASSI